MYNMVFTPSLDKIKFDITDKLTDYLKKLRLEYKVNANVLAGKIGKSNAYISKFDKGDYKNISLEDLILMIESICGDKDTAYSHLDKYVIEYFSDPDRLKDTGIKTYDDVIRQIDVPETLVDFINSEIERLGFTVDELINRINDNKDLDGLPKYDYNLYTEDDNGYIIYINLDIDTVKRILAKELLTSNWITLNSILYTLSRIDKTSPGNFSFGIAALIADNEMIEYKMYNLHSSIVAKLTNDRRISINQKLDELPDITLRTIYDFVDMFSIMSKKHLHYIIYKSYGLNENLGEDPSMLLALLGLPYDKTKSISTDKKKELLKDIADLFEKYSKIEDSDKYQLL